ncbi:unnamed protein product, partial [Ixodes persulcatus]
SFFCTKDALGRPNTKASREEVLWIIYAKVCEFSVRQTCRLVRSRFSMGSEVQADWFSSIREVTGKELVQSQRMGGPNEVVQIDEAFRHNNYDNRIDGPWVLGMICDGTKELRMFYVQRRDSRTLGDHIRQNVAPGTTVFTDEWRGYVCVDSLQDGNGPMGLHHFTVNHSQHFIDPITKANTQLIEQSWEKSKLYLLRKARGCSGRNARTPAGKIRTAATLQTHLDWLGWKSMNGPIRCKDPFLRVLDIIARHYPMP